jgi:hypothetical protein
MPAVGGAPSMSVLSVMPVHFQFPPSFWSRTQMLSERFGSGSIRANLSR